MLVNLTNHRYDMWSPAQKEASLQLYTRVQEYPFPAVPVAWTCKEVKEKAEEVLREVQMLLADSTEGEKNAVLCQGEFSLTYAIVQLLQREGILVVCATTERVTSEKLVDGKTRKISEFCFRGFREYPEIED